MPPNKGGAKLKLRYQIRSKLYEIKQYIDEQRGNEPEDSTGLKVIETILNGMEFTRRWPWSGQRIQGLGDNYRRRRVGRNYMVYYYVVDPERLIYIVDLRHSSQKPLSPSTIRKYKSETEKQ